MELDPDDGLAATSRPSASSQARNGIGDERSNVNVARKIKGRNLRDM